MPTKFFKVIIFNKTIAMDWRRCGRKVVSSFMSYDRYCVRHHTIDIVFGSRFMNNKISGASLKFQKLFENEKMFSAKSNEADFIRVGFKWVRKSKTGGFRKTFMFLTLSTDSIRSKGLCLTCGFYVTLWIITFNRLKRSSGTVRLFV